MVLYRLAMLYFDKKELSAFKDGWSFSAGDMTIETRLIGKSAVPHGDKKRFLVFSSKPLSTLPPLVDNRIVEIPTIEREQLEGLIEFMANIISLTERCSRTISSPSPCVALKADNEQEENWLSACGGIKTNRTAVPFAQNPIEINEEIIRLLSTRVDGVAILAEALASRHAGNKYREFIRLFELAFKLSSSTIEKKLSQFLDESNLGYSRDEVSTWLNFRHGSMHADGKKSTQLVLEADVIKFIPRMEQAAYDVLFNKAEWGVASKERVSNYKVPVATTNSKADLLITRGKPVHLSIQAFDEFQVYPLDLGAEINSLPDSLWSKWA